MAKRSDTVRRGRRNSIRPKRRGRRLASQAPPARRSLLPSLQFDNLPEMAKDELESFGDDALAEAEASAAEEEEEAFESNDRLALTPTPNEMALADDAGDAKDAGEQSPAASAVESDVAPALDPPMEDVTIEERAPESGADVLVVPPPRRSRFSRPPAPALGFGAARPSVEIAVRTSTVPQEWLDEEADEYPHSDEEALESAPASSDPGSEPEAVSSEEPEPGSDAEGAVSEPTVERASFAEETMESHAPSVADGEGESERVSIGEESAPSSALRVSGLPQEGGNRSVAWLVGLGLIALIVVLLPKQQAQPPSEPDANAAQSSEPAAPATPSSADTTPSVAAAPDTSSPEVEPAATELNPDLDESMEGDPSNATDYKVVEKTTLRLLTEQDPAAEGWARRMIELRPKHALGYRCLGAALQNKGDLKGARRAFDDCVSYAKSGNYLECSQLGGIAR